MTSLHIDHISKSFPGVKALDNVSISILPGEIHAICGENGAGKSTLMNILTGNLLPDGGNIILNEKNVTIKNPTEAFDLGISIVYQHLSLVDSLSVAENIFANQQPCNNLGIIQFQDLYKKTTSLLQQLGLDDMNPRTLVSKLSQAHRQMVEIAKALSKNPSIFILDEPTASLTEKETKILFTLLRQLKSQGTSVIYISHRLDEVFLLSDHISILKDGKSQGTFSTSELSKGDLIKRMVGREIKVLKTESHVRHEVLLEVNGLSGERFNHVSFKLHRGEIVGMAGLIGAGRTEIARAIFGADKIIEGHVLLRNKPLKINHPAGAIANGIAYVPEERKSLGLFPDMSIQDNVIAANLENAVTGKLYNQKKAHQLAAASREKLRIGSTQVEQKVISLSGGNQQKVVLAKWLLTNPDLFIVDEPTHGIDVGAKQEIYEILKSLAQEGKGILIISSDLPELIGLCDRILIIKKGVLAGELSRPEFSEEKIMLLGAN